MTPNTITPATIAIPRRFAAWAGCHPTVFRLVAAAYERRPNTPPRSASSGAKPAIGLAVVLGAGLLYLFVAKPDRHSESVAEDDAIEVANVLRSQRPAAGKP